MALAEEESPLPTVLAGCWTRDTITALARKKRAVQRARKKDIWILLWSLIFGFAAGSRRTLLGLWETYNQYAKEPVSSSTFQGWLSDNMAVFLKALLQQALNESRPPLAIEGHILARFTELLAIDSTVLNLYRSL